MSEATGPGRRAGAGDGPGPIDLLLELDPRLARRAGLESALRAAIRGGRLAPGARLPSSRALARDLGLARGTVAEAYAQLASEGFLVSRRGAGTVVAATLAGGAPERSPDPLAAAAPRPPGGHDLRPGVPDLSAFPRRAWLRATREVLRRAPDAALGYGDPRGAPVLREALADYLARARGVVAAPERIVVCAGFRQGLALVCRALRERGVRALALEDPGLPLNRATAAAAGLAVETLPVDGDGAVLERLDDLGAGAVLLTPAHQFPLGATLGGARRRAAVGWARLGGGFVLEDDYDGEFHYDAAPTGAMRALAPEHVVYLGTASKTLGPALRIGWLVLPAVLVEPVVELKRAAGGDVPALDQLALAELIATGAFERHVRRMRLVYRRRRELLRATLARRCPQVAVGRAAGGLHALLTLPPGAPDERTLEARAAHAEVLVHGLYRYRGAAAEPGAAPVLLASHALGDHVFPAAVDALCGVLARALAA